MARLRNPKRDKAFQIWVKSNGKRKLKEITAELDLSNSQIRKWKNQDKWDEQLNGNVSKRKRGAPVGNKNASGHGSPKGNSNALKHGLFSKYIPEGTLEIMGMLEEKSPADLIYDQIMIQYAAIIRAQKIMYVRDKYDLSKELKKENEFEFGSTYEYEIKCALDRQLTS
ncbi:phage terminase small subunit [Heyndrickxia ginsengihumi]|uniref:PBSX phage terminase small subunit-like N-terminal domain-containing protein n=1 Tax=Heyndrickxia ginsengihumi TaxID=363870 RepID=A0A6M0P9M1_9BACI|nr:phage terminase small subunit [Heyndrickxia ginsengihumi]NEY21482.1 hypothetical protein [Heyndrickxia ginsengihumi]